MILLDKGYFDYDYQKTPPPPKDWVDTIKSDDEVVNMLSGFGFNHLQKNPKTDEEIQEHIINQIKEEK